MSLWQLSKIVRHSYINSLNVIRTLTMRKISIEQVHDEEKVRKALKFDEEKKKTCTKKVASCNSIRLIDCRLCRFYTEIFYIFLVCYYCCCVSFDTCCVYVTLSHAFHAITCVVVVDSKIFSYIRVRNSNQVDWERSLTLFHRFERSIPCSSGFTFFAFGSMMTSQWHIHIFWSHNFQIETEANTTHSPINWPFAVGLCFSCPFSILICDVWSNRINFTNKFVVFEVLSYSFFFTVYSRRLKSFQKQQCDYKRCTEQKREHENLLVNRC